MRGYWEAEQIYQTERVADALEDQRPAPPADGCVFVELTRKDGSPQMFTSLDGKRHKVYVKFCEDDTE